MLLASDVKPQEGNLRKWLAPRADAYQLSQLPVSLNYLLVLHKCVFDGYTHSL